MKTWILEIRRALLALLLLVIVCCVVYPCIVWAIGQLAFSKQANGSLIINHQGLVRGSELLGQGFSADRYFHPRPSAAGTGYDGLASSGSNLGPTSKKLQKLLQERIARYRLENRLGGQVSIPADAVTASASGLDPHISLHNAQLQAPRVARARNLSEERVRELIRLNVENSAPAWLGPPVVNVLRLNLALDPQDQ